MLVFARCTQVVANMSLDTLTSQNSETRLTQILQRMRSGGITAIGDSDVVTALQVCVCVCVCVWFACVCLMCAFW